MIHFYHVTKRFDAYSTALHDVTFHIEKGEFVFLTGPSGAGKSTLLKLILRQMRPTEGQIVVNGRNLNAMKRSHLPYFRREIGMVFQDFKLIERMTIFENLSFILTAIGLSAKQHKKKAYGALRAVNLQHKMNYYPLQLSGGEQQRVAIARALINDPLMVIQCVDLDMIERPANRYGRRRRSRSIIRDPVHRRANGRFGRPVVIEDDAAGRQAAHLVNELPRTRLTADDQPQPREHAVRP